MATTIEEAIEKLQDDLTAATESLQSQAITLSEHLVNAQTKIAAIESKFTVLDQEDDDLHEEIHEVLETLSSQLATTTENLTTQTNRLSLHLTNSDSKIAAINNNLQSLYNKDLELHSEIHDVAVDVNGHDMRLDDLEDSDEYVRNSLNTLSTRINTNTTSLQTQINAQDIEHHQEIHDLATVVDSEKTRLDNLILTTAGIPKHVVLSEDEYANLGTPDPAVFYFTYEQ